MLYKDPEVDVGNPRRPFRERSAKLLFRSLGDVEASEASKSHSTEQPEERRN